MQQIQDFYVGFLNLFPGFLHPAISIGLAILLVVSVIQVLKRNFVYLILLVILLPASIPILKNILDTLIGFVKFVLGI
ncbi:MAG: hypothetical protein IT410_01200 [Candidatus Doudnabacteria bacterium]|nr:hypothetical protein [Candidatus Doudnabacteria bacterium]